MDIIRICLSQYFSSLQAMGFQEFFSQYVRPICVSEKYNSTLMWSHYASNQMGVCVGLKNSEMIVPKSWRDSGDNGFRLRKVEYSSDRAQQSLNTIMRDPIGQAPHRSEMENILYRKAMDWSYEKEWRICYDVEDPRLRTDEFRTSYMPFNPQEDISEILIGVRARYLLTKDFIPLIKQLIEISKWDNPPKFYLMRVSARTHRLERSTHPRVFNQLCEEFIHGVMGNTFNKAPVYREAQVKEQAQKLLDDLNSEDLELLLDKYEKKKNPHFEKEILQSVTQYEIAENVIRMLDKTPSDAFTENSLWEEMCVDMQSPHKISRSKYTAFLDEFLRSEIKARIAEIKDDEFKALYVDLKNKVEGKANSNQDGKVRDLVHFLDQVN